MLAEIKSYILAKRSFPSNIRLLLDAYAAGEENA